MSIELASKWAAAVHTRMERDGLVVLTGEGMVIALCRGLWELLCIECNKSCSQLKQLGGVVWGSMAAKRSIDHSDPCCDWVLS
jgi:hypothetical protein